MKILVTGGAGFVGSNLVDMLVENPDNEVWVIDNLATGKREFCNEKANYLFVDIMHLFYDSYHEAAIRRVIEKKYTSILRNIDVIYHLAAQARIQPSFSIPRETLKINASGTALVCEYARKIGAKLVYAGSSSCYNGVYKNPYTFSKWQAEETCKLYSELYGLDISLARFFNVYGPRHPTGEGKSVGTVVGIFEEQYKAGQPLTIVGDGEQRRDFTHIEDICRGLVAIANRQSSTDIINLGTGKNYSINELASFYNCEVKNIDHRRGEGKTTLADITKTTEMLDWKPKHSLEKYVKKWLKANRRK